jgi:DNA-binding transcriptional ArsR family regulator
MPSRSVVTQGLAKLFGSLSHPHRVRIIEELRGDEKNVKELEVMLGISHSRVSQHLAILRGHRIVTERREGRKVYYHLTNPDLANWILEGLDFIEEELDQDRRKVVRTAVRKVRNLWRAEDDSSGS